MSDLRQAKKTFEEFEAALSKKDIATAQQKLSSLKVALTSLPALPPLFQQTTTAQQELCLARDVWEHAVFLSILQQDDAAFERSFLQLKTYFTDARHLIPQSPKEPLIVGLNLLRLLVQNRIAEFHTDLELLSPEIQNSEYIKLAARLDQWLMEGAYNKVLDARMNVPDESYSYFMEKLLATVRDEIAECSERAYSQLSASDAKRLMLFSSDQDLTLYANERNWDLQNGKLSFGLQDDGDVAGISATKLISNTLTYARELERIV